MRAGPRGRHVALLGKPELRKEIYLGSALAVSPVCVGSDENLPGRPLQKLSMPRH
jgi:hypothetical protein